MLKTLAKGLLGRALAYGAFGLGFWLLLRGFLESNVALGVGGGAMLLAAMYFMVNSRRAGPARSDTDSTGHEEESAGDSFDRSDQGN